MSRYELIYICDISLVNICKKKIDTSLKLSIALIKGNKWNQSGNSCLYSTDITSIADVRLVK